jgi:GNAT superfamily N-acetyltransferase
VTAGAGPAIVTTATPEDLTAWLVLAGEVEHLFGPMVGDREFHRALERNVARGTALCARADGAALDAPLSGALMFSVAGEPLAIRWLAVARSARRRGVGTALLRVMFAGHVAYPCTVEVDTFGADHPGAAARRFYERLGFAPAEMLEPGPEGGSRQMFRMRLAGPPSWVDRSI